jgi:hypothetical protein
MLYCDSRCSQTLPGLSPALPGALLCKATRRLGNGQRVILRQRVQGSVRAVRAVRNTRVFQTETRVVADEAEERQLQRMAKVYDFLEMWPGSQNLRATQKESRAQNKQITAVGYTSDTEEIVKDPWSHFQHDGAAAFKLSERSRLQPALSAKELPGGRTQILNVRRTRRINRHPVKSDKDSAPESISDTEDWIHWNGDLDNPNDSEEDCAVDDDSDIEPNNCIEDPECPEQQDVSAAPNLPGLVRPTRKSKRQAEKVLMTVNASETLRNNGGRKK